MENKQTAPNADEKTKVISSQPSAQTDEKTKVIPQQPAAAAAKPAPPPNQQQPNQQQAKDVKSPVSTASANAGQAAAAKNGEPIAADKTNKNKRNIIGCVLGASFLTGALALMGLRTSDADTQSFDDIDMNADYPGRFLLNTSHEMYTKQNSSNSFEEQRNVSRTETGTDGFFVYDGKVYPNMTNEEWNTLTPEEKVDFLHSVNVTPQPEEPLTINLPGPDGGTAQLVLPMLTENTRMSIVRDDSGDVLYVDNHGEVMHLSNFSVDTDGNLVRTDPATGEVNYVSISAVVEELNDRGIAQVTTTIPDVPPQHDQVPIDMLRSDDELLHERLVQIAHDHGIDDINKLKIHESSDGWDYKIKGDGEKVKGHLSHDDLRAPDTHHAVDPSAAGSHPTDPAPAPADAHNIDPYVVVPQHTTTDPSNTTIDADGNMIVQGVPVTDDVPLIDTAPPVAGTVLDNVDNGDVVQGVPMDPASMDPGTTGAHEIIHDVSGNPDDILYSQNDVDNFSDPNQNFNDPNQ